MTESRVLTQEEFWAEARERFGLAAADWAFQCPSCGDVATGAEIAKALAEHPRKSKDFDRNVRFDEVLGQECIGRILGKGGGRGCQYAAFGFVHGPWQVALPYSTRPAYCFPLAPAPAGDQGDGQ
ncbi:VVA0879 family protein [Streptomyces sp. NPDC030592]|uniref:VVA0879 family protein n=1 Tax=Streptomyces sp. NPDC030592 TaxID=3155365 RepID=UPI0034084E04